MARGRYGWLGLVAVATLLSGCGGGVPAAGEPAGTGVTPTATAVASPSPVMGAPLVFADSKGFRYSLSLTMLGTVVENVVGIAPPGQVYPVFSARVTNLQDDRSAPWPQFTTLSLLHIAVPQSSLKEKEANWDCSRPGVIGCIRGLNNLTCYAYSEGGDTGKISMLSPPIPAGATVDFSCGDESTIYTPNPADLRLYYDARVQKVGAKSNWQEVPLPPRS